MHSSRRAQSRLVSAARPWTCLRSLHWSLMSENLFSALESAGSEAGGLYVAHCDGGSRGNPGPAGYGAVIEDPEGRVVARLSEYLGRQTNNNAEYKALLAVLNWALQHGVEKLRVISDSELMVNQMKGRYKVASPGEKDGAVPGRTRAMRQDAETSAP